VSSSLVTKALLVTTGIAVSVAEASRVAVHSSSSVEVDEPRKASVAEVAMIEVATVVGVVTDG